MRTHLALGIAIERKELGIRPGLFENGRISLGVVEQGIHETEVERRLGSVRSAVEEVAHRIGGQFARRGQAVHQ